MAGFLSEVMSLDSVYINSACIFHILSVIALDPAGVNGISGVWDQACTLIDAGVDGGTESEAITVFRFLANLYATEEGVEFVREQQPIMYGLALKGVNRKEEMVNEAAAALFVNVLLTYTDVITADEFLNSVKLLMRVVRRARYPLPAVYAGRALALLAGGCQDIKEYLRNSEFADRGIPMKSSVHRALQADFAAFLRT